MEHSDNDEIREEEVAQPQNFNRLQVEAMMAEITRRLQTNFDQRANQANDVVPDDVPPAGRGAGGARHGARRGARLDADEAHSEFSDGSSVRSLADEEYQPHHRRRRDEDNLGNLKLRIPPFLGKNDPDVYLDWEKKMDSLFNCQHYSEGKKVKLAATEFSEYAINWWDQITTTRRRQGEPPVASWFEMKTIMKRRFVPPHYGRELHQRLRRLTQGTKSVADYHQEMELLIMKAEVIEDAEATMARFQGGLNREIQDRLELQDFDNMHELYHKAVLIEQQVKRRTSTRNTFGSSSKTPYDRPSPRPREGEQATSATRDDKGKSLANPNRARNVRCFKCQGFGHYANECINKKVMILLDSGEVVSEDEGPDQGAEDDGVDYPAQGELLVTRRTLSAHATPKEQEQRENLFHTRCLIHNRVCSLIVDGGSCTNVASQVLVDKLNLTAHDHPKPYSIQWLNDEGEMRVKKQVTVPITIGRYQDEITCDVLPMEASTSY